MFGGDEMAAQTLAEVRALGQVEADGWITVYQTPAACDHSRQHWRGRELPCATPGCRDGVPGTDLVGPYRANVFSAPIKGLFCRVRLGAADWLWALRDERPL